MTKQQSKRGGVKPIKAWAVTSPDAKLGICWRPSPLWQPTPLAIFETKEEAISTMNRYNETAIVPKYEVIEFRITPIIKKARAKAQIKRK